MKHEGGTKRQIFKEEEEEDTIMKKANVVQINYKYNCQEWNLLNVF